MIQIRKRFVELAESVVSLAEVIQGLSFAKEIVRSTVPIQGLIVELNCPIHRTCLPIDDSDVVKVLAGGLRPTHLIDFESFEILLNRFIQTRWSSANAKAPSSPFLLGLLNSWLLQLLLQCYIMH